MAKCIEVVIMGYGHYDLTLSTSMIYSVEDLSFMYGISEIGVLTKVYREVNTNINRNWYTIKLDDDVYKLVFANVRDIYRVEYLMNLDVDNDYELHNELSQVFDLFYELFNFVKVK